MRRRDDRYASRPKPRIFHCPRGVSPNRNTRRRAGRDRESRARDVCERVYETHELGPTSETRGRAAGAFARSAGQLCIGRSSRRGALDPPRAKRLACEAKLRPASKRPSGRLSRSLPSAGCLARPSTIRMAGISASATSLQNRLQAIARSRLQATNTMTTAAWLNSLGVTQTRRTRRRMPTTKEDGSRAKALPASQRRRSPIRSIRICMTRPADC